MARLRERAATGEEAILPTGDIPGSKIFDENREIFGYDAEDAADNWWVQVGLLAERARGHDWSTNIELGVTTTAEE